MKTIFDVVDVECIDECAYEYANERSRINLSIIFFDMRTNECLREFNDKDIELLSRDIFQSMKMKRG